MNLKDFDIILVSTSAGKDSQAMLDYVASLAREAGVLDRVVTVHADLGDMEWQGCAELAKEQSMFFQVPQHYVVTRELGDLLSLVRARGMWPDIANQYCTSYTKRDQIDKLITALVNRFIVKHTPGRRVKVLSCMGLRSEESPRRAKRAEFSLNKRCTNGKREVFDWLPIKSWTTAQVWESIRKSGAPYHRAYDLGMPRLSCMFCVFANPDALMIAGKENPTLLERYVETEKAIGHTFKNGFKIESIKQRLDAGEQPPTRASGWECGM